MHRESAYVAAQAHNLALFINIIGRAIALRMGAGGVLPVVRASRLPSAVALRPGWARAQNTSKIPAAPMPVPMHMVTMP